MKKKSQVSVTNNPQGDINIVQIDGLTALTTKATPVPLRDGNIVLGYGEVTGHMHAIYAPTKGVALFRDDGLARALVKEKKLAEGAAEAYVGFLVNETNAPVPVKHGVNALDRGDHGTQYCPPGVTIILPQREWDVSEAIERAVAD